eukprot:COSAG02_NODE_57536_length_280_cov_0.790055_1_plen_63_part_00
MLLHNYQVTARRLQFSFANLCIVMSAIRIRYQPIKRAALSLQGNAVVIPSAITNSSSLSSRF